MFETLTRPRRGRVLRRVVFVVLVLTAALVGAFMEGTATLTGGRLHLGDEVKPGTLRLLRLAPWVELVDHTVVLGELRGRLRLDRGRVTVHRLLYESTGGIRTGAPGSGSRSPGLGTRWIRGWPGRKS